MSRISSNPYIVQTARQKFALKLITPPIISCQHSPVQKMIFYSPGKKFVLGNQVVTIDYVIIRKRGMLIQLMEVERHCRPEDLKQVEGIDSTPVPQLFSLPRGVRNIRY